jgi:hypothetical protein
MLPFAVAGLLATWSWGQTVPVPQPTSPPAGGGSESPQSADRSTAVPIHSSNSWNYSPREDQPYEPLGVKKKFYVFGYRIVEPSSFGKSLVSAAIAQWRNSPEEWGQGMAGFGRRYGHRLATRGVENVIGFGAAAALHEDPRYFRLETGSFARRSIHSLSYVLLTRNDNGNKTFSTWRVAGSYGAEFVANTWRPADRSAGDALVRGTVSIGYAAAANFVKEFWPDIRRKVFKK